jgi:hypothetical protein
MPSETLEVPATAWLTRFEGLLRETMPYLRHIAPELAEETLIQLGSRLVELRLGGVGDLGADTPGAIAASQIPSAARA